jgi:hypothetical protein
MRRRSLSISTLLIALLLSVCGNVLAVTCLRAGQDHACCHARAALHPASHHGMGEMEMVAAHGEHKTEQRADANADAFGQPAEACEHCAGRSQQPAPTAAPREADQSKRVDDLTAPLASSNPLPATQLFTPSIAAREHAPPLAVASARHVLISVFRI